MKQMNANKGKKSSMALAKRVTFVLLLCLVCIALSACYMDPDRVVDENNGLNNGGNENFAPVVTDTPYATATPTPAPAQTAGNEQVDWTAWNFGDAATNPPSNNTNTSVTDGGSTSATTPPSNGGTVTAGITTNTPTPKPTTTTTTSTGSSSLKTGSTGTEVKTLQQRLKDLGYYKGSVDGSYGAGTANAVKAFQAASNLTADGVAGKKTLEAVYSKNAIKASATNTSTSSNSSSSTSSSSSSSTTSSSYTNGRTDVYLEIGSSGNQVKILQNRLIVLGYLTGTADGDYGETTYAAVKAFQKRNSIYDDGVAGPTTLTKLYSSSAKKAASVVANLGSLKQGANGSAVRALQQQLKTLGYYTGSVDGDYGSGTVLAVTNFQAANGLTADGIAGKATQNAIYAAVNGTGSGGSSSGGGSNPTNYGATASSNGYTTISSTSGSNANITAVQSALLAKGYYSGSLDGSFGSGTEAAIKSFQSSMGLRVTGMAGPTTQRLLYGGTSQNGSYSKLQQGDSGSKVKQLQYALYELMYYDGEITGSYDTATVNAVLTFQQVHGLTMDGIAGQQTQQILYSSSAIPCNV
ncbi:MAG: peptidoglycan-binding protein [Eubacteriales bacterium]|nr:peptidoglycan-binding protein [Eubacteriales bacterium]